MGKSNLYVGNRYIGDIYSGSSLISQVYKGNNLVYDVYYSGQVLFESSTPGTYTFTPKVKGLYEVIVIGAGGGGAAGADQPKYSGKSIASGGGSGAGVIAYFYLTGGTSYTCIVGAGGAGSGTGMWVLNTGGNGGQSSFASNIVCGGGTGGAAIWTDRSGWHEGYAGTVTTLTGAVSVSKNTSGNNGVVWGGYSGWVTPAASVYGGYGVGGSAYCDGGGGGTSAGGNGYIKISYVRHSTGNEYSTFTINPTPSDATVQLTSSGYTQVGTSITVFSGSNVSWQVSKTGYITQSGTESVYETGTKDVILVENQPLARCYRVTNTGAYVYVKRGEENVGNPVYAVDLSGTKATSVSQLSVLATIQSITESEISYYNGVTATRDYSSDLYT